jgi:hypothetical protein
MLGLLVISEPPAAARRLSLESRDPLGRGCGATLLARCCRGDTALPSLGHHLVSHEGMYEEAQVVAQGAGVLRLEPAAGQEVRLIRQQGLLIMTLVPGAFPSVGCKCGQM